MAKRYKALVTFIGNNGSLGNTKVAECEITGTTKMDGPNYLDSILKQVYEQVHECEVVDCRASVSGIYTSGRFHHFSCGVVVKALVDGAAAGLHDSVDVYVDRESIEEITEESKEE